MTLNDPLANVLSKMQNAMKVGKESITVKPISNNIIKVLTILKDHGYIENIEIVEDGKGNYAVISGFQSINKCGVIKPQYSFPITDAIKWEQQYLPAKDFGIIIVTTPAGIITLDKAKEANVGGKLIAYCY